MMKHRYKTTEESPINQKDHIKLEIDRTNAKLRHFRGVAASVLNDALKVWKQICEDCKCNRTCDEIIVGDCESTDQIPIDGWPGFWEKLLILGH